MRRKEFQLDPERSLKTANNPVTPSVCHQKSHTHTHSLSHKLHSETNQRKHVTASIDNVWPHLFILIHKIQNELGSQEIHLRPFSLVTCHHFS